MTQLEPGEMIVRKDGRDDFLAVGERLVEVTGDRVAIVTDMAKRAENIDEAKWKKSANVPWPAFGRSFPQKKALPSMPRSLTVTTTRQAPPPRLNRAAVPVRSCQ
jgi:hypothetical protein